MTALAEQLKSEGRIEGQRDNLIQNILTVLHSRFELPYAIREELRDVADLATLDALFKLALSSGSINEFRRALK
jgi:hypothetical protein